MKHLIILMVMMITSTTFTFSQYVGKVFIGNSIEKTIDQCISLGYDFVEKKDDVIIFSTSTNNEISDVDARITFFASPKSKTVWFASVDLQYETKRDLKKKFLKMFRHLKDKHGNPNSVVRNRITWDDGYSFVYIEKSKNKLEYVVASTKAFADTFSEF